ncbi:MAG: DUF2285 domain-containing protein [Alphaproteobacteria bacterium]|nr:DUF2285 domain-containing protein [Alphaproteobacteria bacterium]
MAQTQKRAAPKGRGRPPTISRLSEVAPKAPRITAYDEAHFQTYLRLLDAQAHNAPVGDLVAIIREAAPQMNASKARAALRSHLNRAIWLSKQGYRSGLRKRR